MAEDVGTAPVAFVLPYAGCIIHYVDGTSDGSSPKTLVLWKLGHKHFPCVTTWPFPDDVVVQGIAHYCPQRQRQGDPCLLLHNADGITFPVNILKAQCGNIACTESRIHQKLYYCPLTKAQAGVGGIQYGLQPDCLFLGKILDVLTLLPYSRKVVHDFLTAAIVRSGRLEHGTDILFERVSVFLHTS